jgi:uncharacterized protein YdhG (YjbR/CyaY superfamily)
MRPKTVDEYLAGVPEPARSTLQNVRASIRAAAPPEATECIAWSMAAFRCGKLIAGYAAFKNHCSYFPMSSAVIKALEADLRRYSVSKGLVRFPLDKPLPATLVRKLVKARLQEIEQQKR